MTALKMNEMEKLKGGDGLGWAAGVACGLSLAWPIGTLVFGPSCIGLGIGALAT